MSLQNGRVAVRKRCAGLGRQPQYARGRATRHRPGSLRLASSRISVGAVNGVSDGLVLSNAQLRDLAARELIFDSRSSLDVYGSVNADIDSLVINAAGIIGHTPGGDVRALHRR